MGLEWRSLIPAATPTLHQRDYLCTLGIGLFGMVWYGIGMHQFEFFSPDTDAWTLCLSVDTQYRNHC